MGERREFEKVKREMVVQTGSATYAGTGRL